MIDGIITYISSGSEIRQKKFTPLAMGIVEKLLELESAKEGDEPPKWYQNFGQLGFQGI